MSSRKWLSVDTRHLGHTRESTFDGFLHLLPRAMAKQHIIDIRCWCEPRILWSVEADTILVSHRDLNPETPRKKGKK